MGSGRSERARSPSARIRGLAKRNRSPSVHLCMPDLAQSFLFVRGKDQQAHTVGIDRGTLCAEDLGFESDVASGELGSPPQSEVRASGSWMFEKVTLRGGALWGRAPAWET